MHPAIIRHHQSTLKRVSVTVRNLTTGKDFKAFISDPESITVSLDIQDQVRPGDLIRTRDGHRYISDTPAMERIGTLTYPAPRVRHFAKVLRYESGTADQFGRPSDQEPSVVIESIPLCIHLQNFYCMPVVQQGDILQLEDGSRYLIKGTNYVTGHTLRLKTVKQHSGAHN